MRYVRLGAWAGASLLTLFVLTAPWHVGSREVGRLSVALGAALVVAAVIALPGWSEVRRLLQAQWRVSREAMFLGVALIVLFLVRITIAEFLSLNVNAWDFSLYFDRPLERTVHGQLLFSDYFGRATLAAHADFILLLFAPLYAIHPSPYWLVIGQAVILGAGCAASFAVFRTLLQDDFAALVLAQAFLLNRSTARAAQYVFHFEVFYPLALFLVIYAFLSRRPVLLVVSCLLTLTIKQDAALPLVGLGVLFGIVFRRTGAALIIIALAVAGFALDYFVIMPHFAATTLPWYRQYWSHYGQTPLLAARAMAMHPLRVGLDVMHSGLPRLLATMLFLPLAGGEWLIAAAPAIAVAATSSLPKLRDFDLYYSMPFLPLLFCGAATGAARLANFAARRYGPHARLPALRGVALAILVSSSLIGAGYVFPRFRPESLRVASLLSVIPPGTPVRIQSALYPHAGYRRDRMVLDRAAIDPRFAYLLDTEANTYPLSSEEIVILRRNLLASGRFKVIRAGSLELFGPLR